MWGIILVLSAWGLFAVYSSTGALAYQKKAGRTEVYLFQQFAYLVVGFFIMLITHTIHYKYYLKVSKIILFTSYTLLVLTMFFGSNYNDAQRWLKIPFLGITFQTSDVAKVALILFVARELALRQEDIKDFKKGFMPILIHVAVTCLLIAPSNLSTALVLFSTCMVIMFMGRVSIKHIFYIGAPTIAVLVIAILVTLNTPDKYLKNLGRVLTWKHRIENFNKPSDDPDETYQNDHAKIAIANGGFAGVGPGGSTERNFLPQAYSDFIYAIIAEEYGFIGALFMMLLYLFFMYRAFRIIFKSPKAFGALLAVGLSFALVMQALINMAIAVNLVPNTGLTLPLVSKGGTSIIITSFAFGLIMSVSRYVETEEPNEPENKIAA
ncbi:MAG: FtsW/RodA/SpoVE family cell cycle protein [Bacteroidia bacterium]|nr:FtsW/RodA/SpoVE family cell cycle protein [Bacteroidia bacterium]MCF8426912.1 FtsW/RodA/SpoVE family cell cycle protein [Bacteroidia bacterium]MCF8448081.1 FtsW/RodA/SpoVE family cell cycle protein [Bacteroidia bacterium]